MARAQCLQLVQLDGRLLKALTVDSIDNVHHTVGLQPQSVARCEKPNIKD